MQSKREAPERTAVNAQPRFPARLNRCLPVGLALAASILVGRFLWLQGSDHEAAQKTYHAAQRLFLLGRMVPAMQKLDIAIRQDPAWAEPVFTRAKLLERSGHIAEARDQALIAHRLAPQDPMIMLKAMRLDAVLIRPFESERLAHEGVGLMPTCAEVHLLLGNSIVAAGQPQRRHEAVHEFQEALHLDPTSATAQTALGKLYDRMGLPTEAEEALKAAGKALDAQADHVPLPVTELGRINQWILNRRETAFALSQVYLHQSRFADSRKQAAITTKASAFADRLKTLAARATTTPPDRSARAEIADICHDGVGSLP